MTDVHTAIQYVDDHVEAIVADGEYGTVFKIEKVHDESVAVTPYRSHDGTCEQDGETVEIQTSPALGLGGVASMIAEHDPAGAVRAARDYWGEDE